MRQNQTWRIRIVTDFDADGKPFDALRLIAAETAAGRKFAFMQLVSVVQVRAWADPAAFIDDLEQYMFLRLERVISMHFEHADAVDAFAAAQEQESEQ